MIKDIEKIEECITATIIALLQKAEKNKFKIPNITFYFDNSSLRVVDNQLCFAVCENFTASITFYTKLISITGTTKQGLINLVVHEVSHALGFSEKDAHKLTENGTFKL